MKGFTDTGKHAILYPQGFRMKAASLSLLFLALVGFSTGACQNKQTVPKNSGAPPDNAAASAIDNAPVPAPVDNAGRPVPLAVINGEAVSYRDFDDYLDLFVLKSMRNEKSIRQASIGIVNNRVLARKAVKDGIDKDPSVKGKIALAVGKIWTEVYWAEVVRPGIKITDADLLKNVPKFKEKRQVFQIVVDDEAKAEALRKRIVEGKEPFEEVAKAESTGLSAGRGGDTGYVDTETERYEKPILDVLFRMKKGEISKVYPTRIGYSIFKIGDIQDEVRQRKDWLVATRPKGIAAEERAIWDKTFQKLKKSHKVVLKEETGKKLVAAMEKKEDLGQFAKLPLVEVDGTQWLVSEIIDPSGAGVIHASTDLEQMVDSRLREYLLNFELEKRGLKAAHPDLVNKELLLRENVLAREVTRRIAAGITVTDAELRKYFDEHRAKYRAPKKLDVSMIEVYDAGEVQQVYAFLAGGKSFAEAAKKYSVNRTLKDGRIGPVVEDQIAPEFAVVKDLKPAGYNPKPVELVNKKTGKKSYAIFRLNEIVPGRDLDFSEVRKDFIEKAVFAQKQEEALLRLFADLKKNNRVEYGKESASHLYRYVKQTPKGGEHAANHP
jgi:parvulin-like peptidyl-prolyl isomerase